MKPLHALITKVNRCRCCQSKYSACGTNKTNVGKSAARSKLKKDLRKEVNQININI